ncbi:OmpA family protein [Lentibacter sp. XHP0401]|uniref:OmpA family protein n=1 Tax=Lentibacter sp. XHP0401 TaxID=2984334 RepID=UPI0021E940A6|nr:OmpA family protein [Lentibacter sp. XHP0401]MCV2894986.1 OmpA family protein [Lentibacter sp. XHP0401]
MRNLLRSTTSLTLCMALVVPGSVPTIANAQVADAPLCGPLGEQEAFPCAVGDGTLMQTEDELQAHSGTQEGSEEQAVEEKAVEAPQEPEIAPEADANAETEAQAGEIQTEADQAAIDQAASDAEAAVADQATADAAKQAEKQAASEAEAASETADQAEQQAASEADQAGEQAEQEAANAEGDAPKQAGESEELEKALEQEQTDATTKDAEHDATVDAESVPADNDTPTDEAQTEAPTETATPPATAEESEEPVDDEAVAARKAERQAARRAERQAEREAARKALEQETADDVTTEEVTTEDTRRSDQDFETTATGTAEDNKDDGLSNLEKALLLGLGAAVVGTILKNGDKVVSNSGDRVIVQDEAGGLRVLKDDEALLRRPGDAVRTERFSDGSTRQTVEKPEGSRIVTIQGNDGTVLRRTRFDARGFETILFDDLADEREVVVKNLPQVTERSFAAQNRSEEELRAALIAQQRADQGRSFSLRQIREISEVRTLAPPIELDAARFATGSAAIAPEQARRLARVGNTLRKLIAENPRMVFLIEGHTDAVGGATYNLALSDRRAETVALALTEYFDVPPENMITQGYGESALKIQTPTAEQANRRAVVRNITNLLRQAAN